MIRTKLRGHQTLVTEFCSDKDYAGILADYGTGKSLCALKMIEERGWKKVLVVTTKLAIDTTWCDEIRKHTDFRFCVLRGTAKQKINLLRYALGQVHRPDRYTIHHESGKPMVFLLNFEGVKSIHDELVAAEFDAIFADESTKLKTFDSERTLACVDLSESIPHRFIMTGFPITEGLSEIYSQIKFLDHGATFGTSYYAFLNRYFVRMGAKVIIKKKSIKEILNKIKPFCIRVTNETLKLPPQVYKKIPVEMTEQQQQLLTGLNETFRLELGKVKIDTKYIFTLLSKSLQICDGFVQHIEYEKIVDDEGKEKRTSRVVSHELEVVDTNKDEALLETLEQINIKRNKVVIWCAFRFSVKKIKKILEKMGIPVLALVGETEDANLVVKTFQRSSDYNVIVATQKKAAESVTLTRSRYGIYYSNIWSNDARLNSEARIRRIGSEIHESIIYVDLVTKGSVVEERMYDSLRVTKRNLIDELKKAFLSINERAG